MPLPRAGRLDLGLAPLCDPSKNYGRIAFLRGESAQAWGSIGLCAAQVSCARGQVFEAARTAPAQRRTMLLVLLEMLEMLETLAR